MRRRVQLTAAADALGDRAGRAPGAARSRGAARPPGGRGEPVRPRGHAAGVDDARAAEPAARAGARGAGGVRSDADGPVRVQPGGGRRVRAGRAGRAGAGRAVSPRAGAHRRRGHERSGGSRRVGLTVPAHAAQPGLGEARLQRPDGQADRAQRVLCGGRRPGADARGAAADARDLRSAGDAALLRRAVHDARRRHRCRAARAHRADDVLGVSPGRHLPDGLRQDLSWTSSCGCAECRSARGRCVGDAGGAAREHERAHDRDRRARGGSDSRWRARSRFTPGRRRPPTGRRPSCPERDTRPAAAARPPCPGT